MRVGVLALQGDFREHLKALEHCGVQGVEVRRVSELESVDALIIPGGESTTIVSLAKTFELFEPIKKRITEGMPVYGSCAGMIMLADKIVAAKDGQETFGGIDITVRRNAFGRQVDSFETDISAPEISTLPIRAIFIRAPWVEKIGKDVQSLASLESGNGQSHVVAVRQGRLLATAFHPEITDDYSVHRYFLEKVCR
ncbi:MAG: pyridoxal 5'-phosphate synthase glutaminase subunit PdxT [Candidatus Planktophila sp.]